MYKLILNEEQAKVIAQALEMFARIGCGEFISIMRHPTILNRIMGEKIKHYDVSQIDTMLLKAAEIATGKPLGVYTGITVADEPNRVAYDVCQVILHRLAWDENPQGGMRVDFHEPIKWSEQPLPTIKSKKEKERLDPGPAEGWEESKAWPHDK